MRDYVWSYDSTPYPSFPYWLTHPDHLETMGRLFNIPVASSESARILEIGAASGGNVIPMAEQLPGSQFVAIDLSAVQVAAGQQLISKLGLQNIELRKVDLREIDESFGTFDYIICHGVFSWVSESLQERLLQVCKERLAPNGIAYISYNTYPGWHLRESLRRMLLYRVRSISDPAERIKQAREFLSYLADSVTDKTSLHGFFLKASQEYFSKSQDNYLLHEILGENNHPIYFHEFMERAQRNRMGYLTNSSAKPTWLRNAPPALADDSSGASMDLLEREQIHDFLNNNSFRQTLLCHDEIKVDRTIYVSSLRQMHVSSSLRAISQESIEAQVSSEAGMSFADAEGVIRLRTRDALVAATLQRLDSAQPGPLSFSSLVQLALMQETVVPVPRERLIQIEKRVSDCLVQLYSQGLIDFCVHPIRCTLTVSKKPRVSPLAAWQATTGQNRITNRRHQLVSCSPLMNQLMACADGTKTHLQLAKSLGVKGSTKSRSAKSRQSVKEMSGQGAFGDQLETLEDALKGLAQRCLLVS